MANFYASYPVGSGSAGGGGSMGTPTQVYDSARGGTIVGAINNANTVYTLPSAPTSAASVEVYLDGLFQTQGVDYTLLGAVITFAIAPNFGQFLDVFYLA